MLVELNNNIWKGKESLFSPQTDTIIRRIQATKDFDRIVDPSLVNTILEIQSPQELHRLFNYKLPIQDRQQLRRLIEANNKPPTVFDLSKIKVMTMHASKGMEAELVVLITTGSYYEMQDLIDYNEEQRVYFVAATRCKSTLAIVDIEHEYLDRSSILPQSL